MSKKAIWQSVLPQEIVRDVVSKYGAQLKAAGVLDKLPINHAELRFVICEHWEFPSSVHQPTTALPAAPVAPG